MADFYSIPLEEMNAFLRSRRFQPVDLTYRNRPVMEWVYERPLPRQPNHVVRVYTGINRYGRSQNQSRGAGKDAIRVQVIYKNGDVETLVTQPKRVHRVTGWADNLDNRLTEIAQSLPQVVFDRRGEPMTLRRKNGKYFWGSRDYPKYKETKPFRAEQIRCCKECDKTTGLTTIQAGTYCYDCLPINLGAEEMFYYHGTDMTNLASILKEGIRPTIDTDSRWGEDIMDISPYPYYYAEIDDILPSVFVADSAEEARWWADESGIENIGVLKISSQVENLENFHGDGNGYKTSETIPKEYIVEVIGKTFAAEEFNSEQDAPLAGQTTEAPYEIKVYVPSTTLDQPISESDFKSRIDETQEKLSELFGGFTTVDASGGYLSQQDGVISEPVIVVSSWATVRDYQSKMGDLERFLKQKKDDWGQEVIGFEFENDFFMYPAFRAEEINLGAEDDIKLFYEGIYDNDGGFGDGNEMKSYSVVSKKDYRNYYEDTKWNPCECDVQGCLSCFLNEYPHQPQFTEGRIVSYGSLWFEDSVWDAETFAAADKNYRSEEIEDDFSIGDILISDLIPKEGDRMLYIPYPTKNDWRERYAAEGHIRVYIAKHNENNNFQIQWREITADRLNLLIDDAVAKLYIADYENTDDLYGKLFVTSEPIWKHLNYNAMLGESYSYMYRLVTSAIPFGGRTNDIFDYLHSGKNYRNSNANYTLNDLEYHDKEWRDRNLGGDPTILNTGFLDGIFADQLPDEKSFLSETYEEATGVEFSEQNPKKIEADAPQDWRESIITIPQSDSFGNALYRKMSDLTYNQVWRVLEIIDDLNRMSHHHALTKFSSNYVEIWIYSHDSGLVMPKDYHWAEDFNDMIATVDWQMWESETEWDDIDWDNSTPSDWGDDISWQDDWGSLRPETRPEFPTVDAKIASMLRNHSKVNVNGEQGCPGCGQEDLFYRESTGTGTKWYCYGCFYTEKTESQKSKKVITLEKYGLKVRCPDCNEMIVAYNQASVNSHRKKCGVTK